MTKLGLRQKLRQSLLPNPSSSSGTVSGTATPNQHNPPVHTGLSATTSSSNVVAQRLLALAVQQLSLPEREILQQNTALTGAHDVVAQALTAATEKRRICLDKRWTCTIAGRRIILREEADKIVHWLDRFKAVGDVVSNADPVHIGLPWAGFRLLLEAAVAESGQMAALLMGCETALYMASRLKAYTEFMDQLPSNLPRNNLEETVVLLYAHILQFLIRAIQLYQTPSFKRAVSAIWKIDEITGFEERGNELAVKIEWDANVADRMAGIQDRKVFTQIQHTLQQALGELQEVRHLKVSLDRLHLKIDLDKIPYTKGAIFDSADSVHTFCHRETRIDLLAEVRQWAQRPGKGIFWLHGAAGAGKSTIAWTFAQWLADQNAPKTVDLGASFFFKRDEGERSSAKRFFPTIVRQLIMKLPGLDVLLADTIDKDPFIFDKSLAEQFKRLLLQPLQELALSANYSSPTLIVVVDALDECGDDQDVQILLQLWSQLSQVMATRIRLFLTSRPDQPLILQFHDMAADLFDDIVLQDAVPRSTIEHDLQVYLKDKFGDIRKRHCIHFPSEPALSADWPGDDILQTLVLMAAPLFIVAATVCRFVGDLEFDPTERLDEILEYRSTGQMAPMEMTYLPVLRHLTTGERNLRDRTQLFNDFRLVVGSIICLAEPLSIADLSILLGKTALSIERRLNPLHSVFQIPPSRHSPVRILHLSFPEFLLNENIREQTFAINGPHTHLDLMKRCLQVLSSPTGLRENICDLDSPGVLRKEVDGALIAAKLPLVLQYACQYWVYHCQKSRVSIRDGEEVHVFLRDHYLHWLEALSFMNRLSEVIGFLDILKSASSGENSIHSSLFLEDARRFILANRYVAEIAPLQLYSSAIMFAPQKSLVRVLCGRIPDWITQHPQTVPEWNFELQRLEGHTKSVNDVAFSPDDGVLLASASDDHTVRLWNTKTGQDTLKLEGHTDAVSKVVFSPDGRKLASVSRDRTIRLWEVQTGAEVIKLDGDTDYFTAVAFSPHDGVLLACALSDWTISLRDAKTGREILKFEGHTDRISSVVFSPIDSTLLASGSRDRTVRLWDTRTGRNIASLDGHLEPISAVAFSLPDGALLASVPVGIGSARLWEVATLKEVLSFDGKLAVAFSPDSSLLATIRFDWTILVRQTSTGQEVQVLAGHMRYVTALTFSASDSILASASEDMTIRVWRVEPNKGARAQMFGHWKYLLQALVLSSDGRLLASGKWASDNTIRLWQISTGQEVQRLEGHGGAVLSLAFSPDNSVLASVSQDLTVRVWEVETGRQVFKLEEHHATFVPGAFSPNGDILALVSDETVCLWKVATGQQMLKFDGHTDKVREVAFSHDGCTVASASWDAEIRLWQASTGQEMRLLACSYKMPCGLMFSPDDSRLLALLDGTLPRIWDVTTGQELSTLSGHRDDVTAMTFSSDGAAIASASMDQTVRLWAVSTGKEMQRMESKNYTSEIKFSHSDSIIATNQQYFPVLDELRPSGQHDLPDTEVVDMDYGLALREEWIFYRGMRLLWLPHEYRTLLCVVSSDTIVFPGENTVHFLKIDYKGLVRADGSVLS